MPRLRDGGYLDWFAGRGLGAQGRGVGPQVGSGALASVGGE